jgi:hypothetical protein
MRRDTLVVGINQYPFLKDTPTSPPKHLTTPAADAEAIAQCPNLPTHPSPANEENKLRE